MTRTWVTGYESLSELAQRHVELLAEFLSARVGESHKREAIRRELQPRLLTTLSCPYISNAANVLREVFGWAITSNKYGICLTYPPAPLIWPDDIDARVRWLGQLPDHDRDMVERLEAAAVEVGGRQLIRAAKAAKIIGCNAGMQTGWIRHGRITPARCRVKPSQTSPSGWVTGWPLIQAINCGLSYRRISRPWTEAEEGRLMELLGTIPIQQVARKLGRTVCAVRHHYCHLGVNEDNAQGLMTVGVVADLCGVQSVTVRKWCNTRKPPLGHTRLPSKRRQYMVSMDSLAVFFGRHPDKFDRLSKPARRRIERATMSPANRRKAVAV